MEKEKKKKKRILGKQQIEWIDKAIDSHASTDCYTNYKSILSDLPFLAEDVRKNIYDCLRSRVKTLWKEGIIEKRNKPAGFRYKAEYRRYFTLKNQEKTVATIEAKSGHEASKLYLTDGLNLLMKGEKAEEPRYQLEYISDLRNGNLITKTKLEWYLGRDVIQFDYLENFETLKTIIFSPHFLKEYNSRWNIVGFLHEGQEAKPVHIPIDRIVAKRDEHGGWETTFKKLTPVELQKLGIAFKTANPGFFEQRYRDVVGMTIYDDMETELVYLKTHSFKDHMYLKTKPIHPSQTEVHPDLQGDFHPWKDQKENHFDREKNEGYFQLEVKINFELKAKILSFGAGVSVVGPESFVQNMKDLLTCMAACYGLRCTPL